MPQHKEPAVYDLGLVLFRDEVRKTASSCRVVLCVCVYICMRVRNSSFCFNE